MSKTQNFIYFLHLISHWNNSQSLAAFWFSNHSLLLIIIIYNTHSWILLSYSSIHAKRADSTLASNWHLKWISFLNHPNWHALREKVNGYFSFRTFIYLNHINWSKHTHIEEMMKEKTCISIMRKYSHIRLALTLKHTSPPSPPTGIC